MLEGAIAEAGVKLQSLFEIGRGGVAVVRAERMTREDGTEQVVAVKRLLPLVAGDEKTREMFFAEARLAAMIHHPNVVGILHVGLEDDPFIAMDLILGESLSSLISAARQRGERPLAPPLAAWVVAQICDALHAAHELIDPETGQQLHLVHRDVSPQNILLGFDGDARLTDFGIAKALGFGSRTRTGEVKGKLPYMSPEQVMCDPMDRRSDLFSVGAVLFELVTGQRMWGDGNEIDVLRKLATEPIPKLEQSWIDAPSELCAMHAHLVERDPDHRPSNAQQVAESLRQFAAFTRDQAATLLSERMRELFPERMDELTALLRRPVASKPALSQATELPVERAPKSRLTIMLTAAIIVGAFAVALPTINRFFAQPKAAPPDPSSAQSPPSQVGAPETIATASATVQPATSIVSTPASIAVVPATTRKVPIAVASTTASAPAPVPKASSPARTDRLDEHPF